MGRGCLFGAGCLIGIAAVAVIVLLVLGIINVDWLVVWIEGSFR